MPVYKIIGDTVEGPDWGISNSMTETIKNCPLCGETEFQPFWIYKHDYRPNNIFQICVRCGGVFANPRPTASELAQYYRSDYRDQVNRGKEPPKAYDMSEWKRSERLEWWIGRYLPAVKRHLDVGSSLGFLLNGVWQVYNCESVGVEPGDEYRDRTRKNLEKVQQPVTLYKDISEVPTNQKFDLITMSHVLEHLPQPVEYLERLVNDYLEPNGHIVVEVPNLLGEVTSLLFPHLIAFTQETLWMTLNRAGLTPISVETSYVGGQIHIAPPPYLTAIGRLGSYDVVSESKEIYGRVISQLSQLMKIRDDAAKAIEQAKKDQS